MTAILCSPHLRGWSQTPRPVRRRLILFPAPAGMVPWAWRNRRRQATVPRTCGDGPAVTLSQPVENFCSPHLRGWSRGRIHVRYAPVLFPAPAGMVPAGTFSCSNTDAVPRTCGDGPVGVDWAVNTTGCSPHLRGWSPENESADSGSQLFPAPAGMIPGFGADATQALPVPRTCGDDPNGTAPSPVTIRCSPHLRG